MLVDAKIRVAVVDDHPVVRKGLVQILTENSRFEVVGEAANGADAVDLYKSVRPDLMMMDLKMPTLNGVEATQAIRAWDSRARIVIMTALDGEEDIYRGMRAGARGYILKDAPEAEVVDALFATMQDRRYLAHKVAAKLADHLNSSQLSERELGVLRWIATGMSNKGVARRAGITEGTVKFHVNNILTKLQCSTRTEAVSCALRRGLIELP
jgi:two-component system NarL family response regulator